MTERTLPIKRVRCDGKAYPNEMTIVMDGVTPDLGVHVKTGGRHYTVSKSLVVHLEKVRDECHKTLGADSPASFETWWNDTHPKKEKKGDSWYPSGFPGKEWVTIIKLREWFF
jgi:hypothetical protein